MSPVSSRLEQGVALVEQTSSEASRASLALRPTHLLIFGDPRVGTPLMIASPSIAIDLPSKALIEGNVWVTYNRPDYIQQRHSVPDRLAVPPSGITVLIRRALETHLYQGFSSFFQSLGVSHPRYNWYLKYIAHVLAIVIAAGFISIPVMILIGVVR